MSAINKSGGGTSLSSNLSESEIQAEIKSCLKKLGYIVRATSSAVRVKRGSNGLVERGLPDLFVTHRVWPVGCWLSLEVKKPGGAIKPEQEALLQEGRIVIVRSIDDAVAAVRAFEVAA